MLLQMLLLGGINMLHLWLLWVAAAIDYYYDALLLDRAGLRI